MTNTIKFEIAVDKSDGFTAMLIDRMIATDHNDDLRAQAIEKMIEDDYDRISEEAVNSLVDNQDEDALERAANQMIDDHRENVIERAAETMISEEYDAIIEHILDPKNDHLEDVLACLPHGKREVFYRDLEKAVMEHPDARKLVCAEIARQFFIVHEGITTEVECLVAEHLLNNPNEVVKLATKDLEEKVQNLRNRNEQLRNAIIALDNAFRTAADEALLNAIYDHNAK